MADYYTLPSKLTTGDGSEGNPWPLARALDDTASPHPGAGDTLWIMDGTAYGGYICSLAGAVGNPVTIRPHVSGGTTAQYFIDSYLEFTLNGGIDATTTTINLTSVTPADAFSWLRDTNILIIDRFNAAREVVFRNGSTYVRAWNASGVVPEVVGFAHSNGATAWASVDGVFMTGDHVRWWLCDPVTEPWKQSKIFNSNPEREYDLWGGSVDTEASWQRSKEGFFLSTRSDVIIYGGIIHDVQDGVFETLADGNEIIGTIFHSSGHTNPGRGNGFAVYLEATGDGVAAKHILAFNNFAGGAQIFGETASVQNITVEDSIGWNNYCNAAYSGNPAGDGVNARTSGVLITSGSNRPQNCAVRRGSFWNPLTFTNVGGSWPNVWCKFLDGIEIIDNVIYGGYQCLSLDDSTEMVVTGNVVFGLNEGGNLVHLDVDSQAIMNASTWNSNTYVELTGSGGSNDCFGYANGVIAEQLPFDNGTANDWRSHMGQDGSSTYGTSSPAILYKVYDVTGYFAGRYHVAIFNPSGGSSIDIPTSVFAAMGFDVDDPFRIYNAQNYESDVVTGTYDGNPVTYAIDATTRAAVQAIGHSGVGADVTTWPEFGALVVFRGVGGSPPLSALLMGQVLT